ncbi:serine/threonine-protein kinase [Flavobacterium celericrescens]|uniref:non-specific serine/threonine protein kinase n=1 Tax=Flavobacterium celericrescens TaxID=2709780 RepID=A0ABX0IG26_9FLAO|nr:serine/threonine-protein kinase [Flavobacterium celericrescens]NHM05308.1 serine/threonine protein kinase [Flavobacterium celericrescens]
MKYKNYEVVEEKGKGGYGTVFKVVDELGDTYALKIFSINQDYIPSDEEIGHFKKRFIRETLTQEDFQSRNIVQIISYDFDNEPMFYIMPLAECTLKEELDLKSLTNAQKINIIYDVLNGLESIHDLGLCHRDIKPSNILKLKDGDTFYYAISDFGLISKQNNSSTSLTLTGTQKSDDHYTALELHIDFKNATLQSDIYSVGCVIHDLFFPDDPRPPMREIIVKNSIWSQILSNCTKDKKEDRYISVDELRNDIFNLNFNDNHIISFEDGDFDFLENNDFESTKIEDWDLLLSKMILQNEYSDSLHFALSSRHIQYLISINYHKLDELANVHSKWIDDKSGFNFNYCDILAYKVKLLYESTPLNQMNMTSKVQCLITLLFLGTSHNRFYVERMFANYVTYDGLNDNLAKRLALEFKFNRYKTKRAIEHLEYSIGLNVNELHPLLIEAYKKIQ